MESPPAVSAPATAPALSEPLAAALEQHRLGAVCGCHGTALGTAAGTAGAGDTRHSARAEELSQQGRVLLTPGFVLRAPCTDCAVTVTQNTRAGQRAEGPAEHHTVCYALYYVLAL